MKRSLLVCALILGATGCAVGPAYRRPFTSVPEQWRGEPARDASVAGPVDEQWWKSFHDPELESLVTRAVAANLDLKAAFARVEEARANRGVVRSNGLPQVNSSISAERNRQVVAGIFPGSPPAAALFPFETSLYQGQFEMSWEADIFGRIRRQMQSATEDLAAQQEDRRNVLVTLLGDVATNYAQVRGYQLRLEISARNIAIQQDTLDLTRDLSRAGQATERDVAQAESQLESTRAAVPDLETGLKTAIHRLSVLLGSEPNSLAHELAAASPLPLMPAAVPVGLPSDLLERRPDIRRAEAQLESATARVGEAKADYFPRFSLTGEAGRTSPQLNLLALGFGNFFSFGPSVSLPIFTAGRTRSNVALQEARVRETQAAYQSAVLTALEETENALVGFSNERERLDRLQRVVTAARTAFELAQVQYKAGLADFLTVLDAERALSNNEDQLAQSRTTVVTRLVSVYRALGGGWPALEGASRP
jgi:NodT family efflux transporter outer membrane factor (OMF) lipoprotein